ncbi:hypothetical protein [Endozoicomonas sp. ONNA1]|uniref:hypothetical protein n=1 Tax=Endozoicomonas sp. ONNA1 TaxID=2828740 RepID=UPI0021498C4B|nr:hypothetical protein [Endozoicomonas sp. ONNA1]
MSASNKEPVTVFKKRVRSILPVLEGKPADDLEIFCSSNEDRVLMQSWMLFNYLFNYGYIDEVLYQKLVALSHCFKMREEDAEAIERFIMVECLHNRAVSSMQVIPVSKIFSVVAPDHESVDFLPKAKSRIYYNLFPCTNMHTSHAIRSVVDGLKEITELQAKTDSVNMINIQTKEIYTI